MFSRLKNSKSFHPSHSEFVLAFSHSSRCQIPGKSSLRLLSPHSQVPTCPPRAGATRLSPTLPELLFCATSLMTSSVWPYCLASLQRKSASNLFGKSPLWIANILPELFFGFKQLFGNGPQTPTDTGLKARRTVQTQQHTVKVPISPPSTPACIPPQGMKFNEHTIYLLEDRSSSPVSPLPDFPNPLITKA